MTDKEIFDKLKSEGKEKRRKIKLLNFLQASVNKKLMFTVTTEEERVNLLAELEAVEINKFKEHRNKFNSSFYSFEPSRSFKFKR